MSQFSQALSLWQQEKISQAAAILHTIIEPNSKEPAKEVAQSHHLLAVYYAMQSQFDSADKHFQDAIKAGLMETQIFHNWGSMWLDAGDYEKAISRLEITLRDPNCSQQSVLLLADCWINVGQNHVALPLLEQLEKDILRSAKDIALDDILAIDQRLEKCEGHEARLRLNTFIRNQWPNHGRGYNNCGNILKALKRYNEAYKVFLEGVEKFPEDSVLVTNFATFCNTQGRYQEALHYSSNILKLARHDPEVLYNHGTILDNLRRYQEAMICYESALHLRPDFAQAHFAHACNRLRLQDYDSGWQGYEWRWQQPDVPPVTSTQPFWRGEDVLTNKTLFVPAEQGLGDVIQFSRFLPLLTQQGINVQFNPSAELQSFIAAIQDSKGRLTLIPQESNDTPHDVYCPLLSLPLALNIQPETIPPPARFAIDSATQQRWHNILSTYDKKRLKVGLTFSGNPDNHTDAIRSIPLHELAPLFTLSESIDFFILQKEVSSDQQSLFETYVSNGDIHDLRHHLSSFLDTAALVEQLDLVISVDTASAHLSATLGKKTWILLAFSTCWRWIPGREDSPWYPSAQLFHQKEIGQWHDVVKTLYNQLEALAMP